MWELYTFWAFVPVMLTSYKNYFHNADLNVSLLSFLIIASGGLACVLSGYLSQRFGVKNIAIISLSLSCLCCCLSPLFLLSGSSLVLIAFLFFWGLVVIADSPLFSTLVAQNALGESRGTSLTIVNCIGFSITIISIQFINLLSKNISAQYLYTLLAAGPILGLLELTRNKRESA
jgi:MFS family permease